MPIRRSPNGARHVRPQPGRNPPEWVVAINRNAWSLSVGTGGRNHPVRSLIVYHGVHKIAESGAPGIMMLSETQPNLIRYRATDPVLATA